MEPEGSLPCSQEPATSPYPESHESNPQFSPYVLMNYLNIILSSMPRPPKIFSSFQVSD